MGQGGSSSRSDMPLKSWIVTHASLSFRGRTEGKAEPWTSYLQRLPRRMVSALLPSPRPRRALGTERARGVVSLRGRAVDVREKRSSVTPPIGRMPVSCVLPVVFTSEEIRWASGLEKLFFRAQSDARHRAARKSGALSVATASASSCTHH